MIPESVSYTVMDRQPDGTTRSMTVTESPLTVIERGEAGARAYVRKHPAASVQQIVQAAFRAAWEIEEVL